MKKSKLQKISLSVTFYKEGDKFIAFSPALNLSTCGDTLGRAKKRFEEMVGIFFEEVEHSNTLEDTLLECGWQKIGKVHKRWQPPIFVGRDQEEINIPCPV